MLNTQAGAHNLPIIGALKMIERLIRLRPELIEVQIGSVIQSILQLMHKGSQAYTDSIAALIPGAGHTDSNEPEVRAARRGPVNDSCPVCSVAVS